MTHTSGERLRHRRKELGLSQERLAADIGMSQEHLSRLERDARPAPGPDLQARIAKALKVKATDLWPAPAPARATGNGAKKSTPKKVPPAVKK